jgi:DNA-binding protein H-NS
VLATSTAATAAAAAVLPGECSSLDKQVAELQASEADLQKHKAELESKLEQLEELLASTTSTRDELQGAAAKHRRVQKPACMRNDSAQGQSQLR